MNILLLGDSLIEYFDWQARFPEHSCINLGMAGELVGGLLARAGSIKRVCPAADRIFIMSGINNVAIEDTGFIDHYRSIIKKLSDSYPGARIYINSLLPTAVDFISNSSIKDINTSLRMLAEETGSEFLDIYRRFTDGQGNPVREYLLDDGVHLSAPGYEAWAAELEKNIHP